MEHCGEPCFDFTIPFGTFYFTDQVWPDYFIEAGTIWLWSNIGHNHVCHNCLGSIIGIICFLDAKWNDLVAGTRLAFGYNLDALCSFLAPFDMGQLRRWRRSPIWCSGVDVIGSKNKTSLSRYANTGPIQNYPPTNLCCICSNHLDRSDLDTRPIMPCNRVKRLLSSGAPAQRTQIFSTLRSALCRL